MTTPRTIIEDFALANAVYQLATVTAFKVSTTTHLATAVKATLYADLFSATTLANPQTLDGEGKWLQPVYVDEPVILTVGNAGSANMSTGIVGHFGLYRGDWVTATLYAAGDTIRDGVSGTDTSNIYYCVTPHTSGTFATDLGAGKWLLYQSAPTITSSLVVAALGYTPAVDGEATAKNFLINTSFRINQRAYVSAAALAAGAFGHDGWRAGAGGCTYTFTQNAAPNTTIVITAGTLLQKVEASSQPGGSGFVSWVGSAQCKINGAGSFTSSPKAFSTTQGLSDTFEFNTGSLGKIKVEIGGAATPYVTETIQEALFRCQRFYQVHPRCLMSGFGSANGPIWADYMLPVPMRIQPAVAFASQSYSNCSSLSLNLAEWTQFTTHIRTTAVLTAAGPGWADFQMTLNAEIP